MDAYWGTIVVDISVCRRRFGLLLLMSVLGLQDLVDPFQGLDDFERIRLWETGLVPNLFQQSGIDHVGILILSTPFDILFLSVLSLFEAKGFHVLKIAKHLHF